MNALAYAATTEAKKPGFIPQPAVKPVEPADYFWTYGTLMRGEPRNLVLSREEFIGDGYLEGALYDTGCGFPAFFPKITGKVVWGEVYRIIHPEIWSQMDRIENGLYLRIAREVHMPDRGKLLVQLYAANPTVWMAERLAVIHSGRWKDAEGA